ncbi:hypothetical protein HISP_08675 [Haloarcula hispanica N601]|uniref:Uncharacterized protein n=1 Tax=Haloarcula hispanica N601 TaxID=1417673 RepID=V5TQ84_HALHI|nr:hypothetical protein HISP_08675 [Haloarcula hispanica N601]
MTNETTPTKENEREPDDESNNVLSSLKIVRLVLEIIALVARLISTL